jgi:tetratricopeptide (TPR) repeat protein
MMSLLKDDMKPVLINHKKLVLAGGVIIIVLLVGGLGLLWAVWRSTPEEITTKNRGSGVTQQFSNKQELAAEVNKKYGENDFKGAITLIEGQKDADENTDLQLLLAGAYANSGDVKKALEIYKKIDNAGKLPKNELANMAEMAERAGDNKAALALYKRAKAYAESSSTISQDEIAVYNYKIAELEKKQ